MREGNKSWLRIAVTVLLFLIIAGELGFLLYTLRPREPAALEENYAPTAPTPSPDPAGAPEATVPPEPITQTPEAAETPDPAETPDSAIVEPLEVQASEEPESWTLILVNADHPVPEDYEITLLELSNGIEIDERIYPPLQEMFDDARAEGVDPTVVEGYRSHAYQVDLMSQRVDSYLAEGYSQGEAETLAREYVAEPGYSEHELGIAVDIGAQGGSDAWEVYTWLASNAHRYGYILRYPEGKEDITGIEYEPWHYRYVGPDAAEEIYAAGITLEEYLDPAAYAETSEAPSQPEDTDDAAETTEPIEP